MKKIVSVVIISSFLLGVGIVGAAEKKSGEAGSGLAGETSAQTQLRQEYLATLERARIEYLAAEKKARVDLKAVKKKAKGKKAGAQKKAAQKAYDAAMKKIRKEFVAAKNAAKKEYAAAKEGGKAKSETLKPQEPAPQSDPSAEQPKESTPQAAAPQPAAPSPVAPAPTIVTYSSSGFSPADLTVKAGTAVTFKNDAEDRLWVASDPHPTHTIYPEFDDKKGIEKGGEYPFTFTKAGEWRYHNHLNPGRRGSVKVE